MHNTHATSNIFLVRHCHPLIDTTMKLCIGRKDIPLSEKGRTEAKFLAEYFKDKNIEHTYSSPLKRAAETASIISNNVIISNNFTELDVGKWDCLSFDEIIKRYPDEYEERGKDFENYIIEGGESMAMCKTRAMDELHKIIEKSFGNVLIVTHAGVIRAIFTSILDIDVKKAFNYKIDYGSISVITVNKSKLKFTKIGDIDYKYKPL